MGKSFRSATLFALTLAFAPVCLGASAADIYRKANPSVVTVITEDTIGSGFFFDKGQVVATNHHVIEGASDIRIRSSGGLEFKISRILIQDRSLDLAILEVPVSGKPLSVDYDLPEIGTEAFSIGSPRGFSNTISAGIVSALRHENDPKYVQFTAPASPGNSGGPLLNAAGNVIGIVTWHRADAQNLNFAVASAHLLDLMRYQATARREKAGEQDAKLRPIRLYISRFEIVGREIRPGVRMTITNNEDCLVTEIDLNIQFFEKPVKNAPTVFRHKIRVQDVINPRDGREIWIPIEAVKGHGNSNQLKDKWYSRVMIEEYQRNCG